MAIIWDSTASKTTGLPATPHSLWEGQSGEPLLQTAPSVRKASYSDRGRV